MILASKSRNKNGIERAVKNRICGYICGKAIAKNERILVQNLIM